MSLSDVGSNLLPLWVPGRERKIEQVAENLEPERYSTLMSA